MIVMEIFRWLTVALGLFMVGGTLLSLSRHPHWFVRGWDFPRVQIIALALLAGVPYALFFCEGRWYDWLFLLAIAGCIGFQAYKVYPYTPLAPARVKPAESIGGDSSLRLLTCNVLMENRAFDRWLEMAREADPDVILTVEADEAWARFILESLGEAYPYRVSRPQDNCYGMILLSRLKLIDPEVRFIVEDDTPSIHTGVELRDGQRVFVHGLHPKPPEPLRGQHATPRDAELVVVGREIDEEDDRPTVVAGDLNDVASSHSTKLFLRLSGLLDPRMGRGFYNTWNARSRFWRFPLDHVFHSNTFRLVSLRVLEDIGSDHFPVLIELSHEPDAPAEQPEPDKQPEHEEEAQEKIDKEEEEQGETLDSDQRR